MSSATLQSRSNSGGAAAASLSAARCRAVGKLDSSQQQQPAVATAELGQQLSSNSVACCLHTADYQLLPQQQQQRPTSAIIADPEESQDAVMLVCTGHACGQVLWAHLDCLNRWERGPSNHQKSASPAARAETSQKLRCPCGKGQLVRDQHRSATATQPQVIARRRQQQTAGSNGYYLMGSSGGGGSYSSPTDMLNRRLRNFSNSSSHGGGGGSGFGTAFSLSPTMSDTSATVPFTSMVYSHQPSPSTLHPPSQLHQHHHQPHHHHQQHQQLQLQHQLRSRGNIFRRRTDNFESLKVLPRSKQNKFHIVTEDDSSTENDELKALVLTTLTACRTAQVACSLCGHQMQVYDHFPLIDGVFFLSPAKHHRSDSPACGKGFLHAVCLHCACRTRQPQLHSRCRYCQRTWDGSHLLIGGIYTFDVLACSPCCPERLLCSHCRRPLVTEPGDLPTAFSHFSQPLACPHCRTVDFHFVRSVSLACRGTVVNSAPAAGTAATSV